MAKGDAEPKKLSYILNLLGFMEDPFNLTSDPRFMFYSQQHRAVISHAMNVIENSRGLAVFTGTYGVGKSISARFIESYYRTNSDVGSAILLNRSNFNTESECLQEINSLFQLPKKRSLTQNYHELEKFLILQAEQHRSVVVIFDEAQFMPLSVIDLIHNFYNFDSTHKLIQILLFGQTEEMDELFVKRPATRRRVYYWHQLLPLTLSDTSELIRFRCNVAGRTSPLFSQDSMINIYEATQGIPRSIVSLCSEIVSELIGKDLVLGATPIEDTIIGSTIPRFLEQLNEQ
jgi:general secretion pathway protein A